MEGDIDPQRVVRHHRWDALLLSGLLGLALSLLLMSQPSAVTAAGFNASQLISDGEFVAIDGMSVAEIQRFLENRSSFLKDLSEGGRSAAQIIWDAAHGKNEASGSINGIAVTESTGTVHPGVILATLQKEQSLVSRTERNDDALRAAMGYACPDSGGCNSTYAGFTKQVENGAWQLRYNYERAQGHSFSDYQVGQSFCTSDHNGTNCGTYDNRATASLYRYTPHVYNGNYNFWNLFTNTYAFASPEYAGQVVSWSSSDGVSTYPMLDPGETSLLTITYRNTGRLSWSRGTVNLGTVDGNFTHRFDSFALASNWVSRNRPAQLTESSVAPGETGTFTFAVRHGGIQRNTHRLDVGLVADGITWFPRSTHAYFEITTNAAYNGQVVSWSSSDGTSTYPTLSSTAAKSITIRYRNTGTTTWQQGVVNLGTVDRTFAYRLDADPLASNWLSANRPATLTESSVAPGETGTFTFAVQNSRSPADTYRLDVGLVADGITWFPRTTHAYFEITTAAAYNGQVVSWSSSDGEATYPTLSGTTPKSITIRYRNTGTVTWTRGTVNLGTVDRGYVYSLSSFALASDWLSSNRPATLTEASIAPGETGTFTFAVQPAGSGTRRLDVGLVADGITWFPRSTHAYWDVTTR